MKTLVDLHLEAVLIAGMIDAVAHIANMALADRNDAIVSAMQETLGATREAAQALMLELEYQSGVSNRPEDRA